MPASEPDPQDSAGSGPRSQPPRPGSHPSAPSASHYAVELPYAEELQQMLGGAYMVESFLGQGGMGAVYQGLQMPLKRPVAIKILQKRQAAGGEDEFAFEERFKREAYAMAALTHPNIVQVYDCGDAGENFLFISMELLEGGDLSDVIKAGAIPEEKALKLICQICDGMQAAHERGIVHRDIKPANIFLTADGRAKVADFGLAKKFDVKSTFVTKTGLGMGTPDYAAPEQYEPEMGIDHRADIYALGVMMYQMLTGRLPRGVYKMPSQMVAVDARIDDIVAKAMMSEREERWQSAAEIKKAILGLATQPPQASSTVRTSAVPTAPKQAAQTAARFAAPAATQRSSVMPVPPPKKSSMGALVGILGVMAAAAVGAYLFLKEPGASSSPSSTGSASGSNAATSSPVDAAFMSAVAAATPERQVQMVEEKMEALNGTSVQLTPTFTNGRLTGLKINGDGQNRGEVKDFSPVAALRDLSEFRIYYLHPTDISFLRGIRLSALTIHGGSFTDVSVLRDMPLTSVEVRNGPERDWSVLAGKPLTVLDLMLTNTSDLSFAKGMPLERLIIERTKVTDLSPIRGMPLKEIKCDFVASRDAEILRSIPTLTRINDLSADEFWRGVGGPVKQTPTTPPASSVASGSSAAASGGESMAFFGGHRYQIVSASLSWGEAKTRAESMGGHLAVVGSPQEHEFLMSMAKRMAPGKHVWIGLSRSTGAQEWTWVTGEALTFRGWAGGQPDFPPPAPAAARYWGVDGTMRGWDDTSREGALGQAFLVEWGSTTSAQAPVVASASSPSPSGPVNLLTQVEVSRDKVSGDWVKVNGELIGSGAFASLTLNYQPPEEYDFRVSFTRRSGNNAVAQHIPRGERSAMWLIGGFFNSVMGFEQVNGSKANANVTTVRGSLENGRRYESLVKIRRKQVVVEIDGRQVVDFRSDGSNWSPSPNWQFPDVKKLGIGCQQETVFHSIEVVPYQDASPPSPAPVAAASPAQTQLPPAPSTIKQTVDLVAALDLSLDRMQAANYTRANFWSKKDGVLTYDPDGGSGKVTAPVGLGRVSDYEIGVIVRRLSGADTFTIDLPVSPSTQSGLDVSPKGLFLGLLNGQRQKIGDWPQDAGQEIRLLARVRFAPDRRHGRVTVTINNKPAGQWEGPLADMGRPLEYHRNFPGEQVTSLFCYRDGFAFSIWQLRVYEGEAKVLRTTPASPSAAGTPAAASPALRGPLSLFDGTTLTGWRIVGGAQSFTVDSGAIKATTQKGALVYVGTGAPVSWTDFELSLKVKTGDKANSGIWIHCSPTVSSPEKVSLQVQIANENGDRQKTGSILGIASLDRTLAHDGTWFDMRVVVRGKTITVYVKDRKVNEWTQPENWQPAGNLSPSRLASGTIGLESWAGETWFKDIRVSVP